MQVKIKEVLPRHDPGECPKACGRGAFTDSPDVFGDGVADNEEVTVVFRREAAVCWKQVSAVGNQGRSRVLFEPLYTMFARYS